MYPVIRRHGFCLVVLAIAVGTLPVSALAQRNRPSPTPKPSPTQAAASPAPAASATPASLPQYALPDTVATVNGQPIKKAELERITETLLNASARSLKSLSIPDQKQAYRQMLGNLIIDRLVSTQAASETVNPLDVETRLDEFRRQYATPAGFEADVKKSGQTLDQIRQNIRNQIAREHWIDKQIDDQVIVTPQEVEKFYQDGPSNKFNEPENVTASHILIKVRRDAPPEEVLTAEKKANEVADRLKKGENFEDVAVQVSEDPAAKKNKGNLGAFSREGVMPEFANAAFGLKVGEVSPPVRTQFGYHLIKVTDRKPAHMETLDEARPRITTFIQEQKRQKATAKVVQKLRDDAKIDITPDLRENAQPSPTP